MVLMSSFPAILLMIIGLILSSCTAFSQKSPDSANRVDINQAKHIASLAMKNAQIAFAQQGATGLEKWPDAQCTYNNEMYARYYLSACLVSGDRATFTLIGATESGFNGKTIVANTMASNMANPIQFCGTAQGLVICPK